MIKLEMNRKQEAILAAIILLAALGIFVLYLGIGSSPEPEPEPEAPIEEAPPPPPPMIDTVTAHFELYDDIDERYEEMFEDGDYTFDNPLIITNPYGHAPLSGLIMFNTETAMEISIHIAGITDDVSIRHTFKGYNTTHKLPVYGLYPGITNFVSLTAKPQPAGANRPQDELTQQLLIETPGIPEGFPGNLLSRYIKPSDSNTRDNKAPGTENGGFYFTHIRLSAFDANGDYRWFYQGFATGYPMSYTDDGNALMVVGSPDADDAVLIEIDMLGRIVAYEKLDEDYEPEGYGVQQTVLRSLYLD